jgi:branched-chain amino acid transport system permease protein
MLTDPTFLALQFLNGLQFAALLFILSIGLSIVFGLLDFVNLAHATLYMFGAYLALTITHLLGSFWLSLLIAPFIVAAIGVLFYFGLLRRMQGKHTTQVLVTLGLVFIGSDVVRMIWGSQFHEVQAPDLLSGSVAVLGQTFPVYRFFVIAVGALCLVLLHFGLERTRLGALVRAGIDDKQTASSLGINVEYIFFVIFALGTWLAGLAGAIAAPVLTVFPGMDVQILTLTLIVVVVGGPGSLAGTVLASLLIGMADTFGRVLFPQIAVALIYLVMALVLLFRPGGLLPARKLL